MREILITSSVLILIVLALRFLFRKTISRRLNYALWGIVLLRLIIPFSLFHSPVSIMNAAPTEAAVPTSTAAIYQDYELPDLDVSELDPALPSAAYEAQAEENIRAYNEEIERAKAETGTPVTVDDILTYVWYAGMAAMTLWTVAANLRFWLRLRKTREQLEGSDGGLRVYVTGAIPSPCLFGLIKPSIYLTPKAVQNERAMRHVIAHEETHARHLDPLWSALRSLCLIVYWFDPFVWLAAFLSRVDCELACDEGAIARLGEEERIAYGETLLSLIPVRRGAGSPILSATTMTSGKRRLKERITRIAEKRRTVIAAAVAVLALILAACAVTFTGAEDRADIPENGIVVRHATPSEAYEEKQGESEQKPDETVQEEEKFGTAKPVTTIYPEEEPWMVISLADADEIGDDVILPMGMHIDLDGDGEQELISESDSSPSLYFTKNGIVHRVQLRNKIMESWPEISGIYFQGADEGRGCLVIYGSTEYYFAMKRYVYFDGENLLLYKDPPFAVNENVLDGISAPPEVLADAKVWARGWYEHWVNNGYISLQNENGGFYEVEGNPGYDDWCLTRCELTDIDPYDNAHPELHIEVYSLEYMLHTSTPELVPLVGGVYIREDNWVGHLHGTDIECYLIYQVKDGERIRLENHIKLEYGPGWDTFEEALAETLTENGLI